MFHIYFIILSFVNVTHKEKVALCSRRRYIVLSS
jgi:hypothetical protein